MFQRFFSMAFCFLFFLSLGSAGCFKPLQKEITTTKENSKSDGAKPQTNFIVKTPKGAGEFAVELIPEVAEEIEIRDLKLTDDFLELRFNLKLKKEKNFADHNWHYTAFKADGSKVCDGILYTRHAIKVGQTIDASLVFNTDKTSQITKVTIHR